MDESASPGWWRCLAYGDCCCNWLQVCVVWRPELPQVRSRLGQKNGETTGKCQRMSDTSIDSSPCYTSWQQPIVMIVSWHGRPVNSFKPQVVGR